MSIQSFVILILLSCVPIIGLSQESDFDFSRADSIARSVDIRTRNTPEIAQLLTSTLNSEAEKARAIYTWVTKTIAYDVKLYHNTKKRQRLGKKSNRHLTKRTLRKKKAICGGYSELFRMLAFAAGLEAQTISGYSKTVRTDIGGKLRADHAWNLVKINGRWEYVDATWGSGYTDKWITKFHREFKDQYFMTSRPKFEMDHKPSNGYWFDDEDKISMIEFRNFPLIGPKYYSKGLEFKHDSQLGLREVSEGDTLRLNLTWDKNIFQASVLPSYSEKKKRDDIFEEVIVSRNKSDYTLDYVIKRAGRFYLTYFINMETLAVFRIESAKRKN